MYHHKTLQPKDYEAILEMTNPHLTVCSCHNPGYRINDHVIIEERNFRGGATGRTMTKKIVGVRRTTTNTHIKDFTILDFE